MKPHPLAVLLLPPTAENPSVLKTLLPLQFHKKKKPPQSYYRVKLQSPCINSLISYILLKGEKGDYDIAFSFTSRKLLFLITCIVKGALCHFGGEIQTWNV